jgi:tyrosine-protein phosphatase SIW14
MLRRIQRGLPPLLVGGALAAAATYLAMRPGDVRHAVTPVAHGVLYRSGQLSSEALRHEILRRGIRTVVNLAPGQPGEAELCRQLGVEYLELPVGDAWTLCGVAAPGQAAAPAAPYDLAPLWRLLQSPDAQPVLVHCTGGVHRTGVVCAMYRIGQQGWLPEDAVREMDLYGFESHKPKFAEVVQYLLRLQPGFRTADASWR